MNELHAKYSKVQAGKVSAVLLMKIVIHAPSVTLILHAQD